jgi:hypothetical protein
MFTTRYVIHSVKDDRYLTDDMEWTGELSQARMFNVRPILPQRKPFHPVRVLEVISEIIHTEEVDRVG